MQLGAGCTLTVGGHLCQTTPQDRVSDNASHGLMGVDELSIDSGAVSMHADWQTYWPLPFELLWPAVTSHDSSKD